MNRNNKQHILYRRWIITIIIAVVIVTLLHLWVLVGVGLFIILSVASIGLFIDWITGADLDKSTGHNNHLEDNISDEEKAFWDYLIWSELFKHKN